MMVQGKFTRIAARSFYLTFFLLYCLVWGQNLQTAWAAYSSVDAELNAAMEKEHLLNLQRNRLEAEIHSLRQDHSWYNGWIVEMILARKNTSLVQLTNSLHAIRQNVTFLQQQREKAFLNLKQRYRQTVLDSEQVLSSKDMENAIFMGQWIMDRKHGSIEFPDYSSILTSTYENETIKHLVLKDLHSVLEGKLTLIDSMLTEKRWERDLAKRLNEFHRDLSLLVESDRDPGSATSRDYSPAEGSRDLDAATTAFTGVEKSASATPVPEPIQSTPMSEDRLNMETGRETIESEIARLELKGRKYQQLLRQIEKELAH